MRRLRQPSVLSRPRPLSSHPGPRKTACLIKQHRFPRVRRIKRCTEPCFLGWIRRPLATDCRPPGAHCTRVWIQIPTLSRTRVSGPNRPPSQTLKCSHLVEHLRWTSLKTSLPKARTTSPISQLTKRRAFSTRRHFQEAMATSQIRQAKSTLSLFSRTPSPMSRLTLLQAGFLLLKKATSRSTEIRSRISVRTTSRHLARHRTGFMGPLGRQPDHKSIRLIRISATIKATPRTGFILERLSSTMLVWTSTSRSAFHISSLNIGTPFFMQCMSMPFRMYICTMRQCEMI